MQMGFLFYSLNLTFFFYYEGISQETLDLISNISEWDNFLIVLTLIQKVYGCLHVVYSTRATLFFFCQHGLFSSQSLLDLNVV